MEDITPAGTGAVQNQPGQTLGEIYGRVDDLAEAVARLSGQVAALQARLDRVIAGTCPQFAEPDPAAEQPAE
ncbi:MAG: hypothetical protein LW650_15390 [Planctomycetaceae bacterium]|nr:hypothetical protein [Planctomycetaceae bacterium]